MRQYLDAKQQHRDAIVFFRMGDFYEMFYEDALVAARALELTLTSRSKDANGGGIPMCGVPFHAVDGYIARLVKKGFRVAICEQVEDPRKAKGLVKREVVRVVSPGTLTDAELSRRARAGVPDGASRAASGRGRRRESLASRCSTSRPESSRPRNTPALDGAAALADEIALLEPREIIVPAGVRPREPAAGRSPASAPAGDAGRRMDLRLESRRAGRCSISCGPAASRASVSNGIGAAVAAAGALVQHLRATQKARSGARARHPRTASAPTRCSSIRRR